MIANNKYILASYYKTVFEKSYNMLSVISVFFIFGIVHITNDKILKYIIILSLNNHYFIWIINKWGFVINFFINPAKEVLFIISLLVLCYPLIGEANIWALIEKQLLNKNNLIVFCVIAILVTPLSLKSMGFTYGLLSNSPFNTNMGVYNRRILMPVFGHIVALYGIYYYYLFSLGLTFILLLLVRIWLNKNRIYLKNYQFASLLTSSFFIYQFQFPGYPDALVFICLLTSITFEISDNSKIILFILALLAHEASVVISIVLSFFILDKKKNAITFYLIVILYTSLWFLSYGGNLGLILKTHDIAGLNGMEWVLKSPFLELLGIAFSYKLLWIYMIFAEISLLTHKKYKRFLMILFLLMAGVCLTLLGVDTSRLMGWSFIALLLSMETLYQTSTMFPESVNKYIFGANLIIPSLYIGLNTGLVFTFGLYKLIYHGMIILFSKAVYIL